MRSDNLFCRGTLSFCVVLSIAFLASVVLLSSGVVVAYETVSCYSYDGNYSGCVAQGTACAWQNNSGSNATYVTYSFCPYNITSFNTTYSAKTGNALVNAGCCSSGGAGGGGGTQGCYSFDATNLTACEADSTCSWKPNNINQNPWCWNNKGCCQKKSCWSFNGQQTQCETAFGGGLCAYRNKSQDPYCSDAVGCCNTKQCGEIIGQSNCTSSSSNGGQVCEWSGSACQTPGGGGYTSYNNTDSCLTKGGWWNGTGCQLPTASGGGGGGGGGGFLYAQEAKCWFADNKPAVCQNVSGCVYCNSAGAQINNASSACYNMPSGLCQGHQTLSAAQDINQSSMTCGDIRLKQTCLCGPLPSCVWSNSSTITGAFCTSGVKSDSDKQACSPTVQFCEDPKAKNNQTLCEQLASDFMMPCKWDNSTTPAKNCTFNTVACFGSGSSGSGTFEFTTISGATQCTAAGGTWKTEYYTEGASLKQDSWCEKGALFNSVTGTAVANKGNCDSDCWACEFNATGGNYNGDVAVATSVCLNSKKGTCQWKNDSNAPDKLGWCDYPKELSYTTGGTANDCNSDCKACEFYQHPQDSCYGSAVGCNWFNDTASPKGGFCTSASKKSCNTDCFNCYDQNSCNNQTVHTALNCSWDPSQYLCKPASFSGEICFNGKDDDNDGKTDCVDGDCTYDQFCGGASLSSTNKSSDCKQVAVQGACASTISPNGKNCTWVAPSWGSAYCDYPGSSCWLYDTSLTNNTASCRVDIGCNYKNATGSYIITLNTSGTGTVILPPTTSFGFSGMCEMNQTAVTICTNATNYNNQTRCGLDSKCAWITDTYSFSGGRCEFKLFNSCSSQQTASACTSVGNCTWRSDTFSQKGGWCESICFSLPRNDTCSTGSGGLCAAKTSICEPEHFSGAGGGMGGFGIGGIGGGTGCHQYDGNYTSCGSQNLTCIWQNFTFGNVTQKAQGICNEKGQFEIFKTMDMSPPKILGIDTNDTAVREIDIREVGVKDMTKSLAFGVTVTNITNAAVCRGYYIGSMGGGPGGPSTGVLGVGNVSTKFYWYLDSNKNTTGGCSATKTDGTNDTGYEFQIKYAVTVSNATVTETKSLYRCGGGVWTLTNVPVTTNRQFMCSMNIPTFSSNAAPKVGGVMVIVDKENLESFAEYNRTAPLRVFVTSANETYTETNPQDQLSSAGYYTHGSADFKFVDCSNPDTKDDKCKNFQKFGFNVFEDCKNGKDDDSDGFTDCADSKCSYTPNCVGSGGAFNFTANANDKESPTPVFSQVDALNDAAYVKFDSSEPANGSVDYYGNDSSCGSINKTIIDVGDPGISYDDYKPFHVVTLDQNTLGTGLSPGNTSYYKTTMCDPSGNCGTSACLNLTTKTEVKNFVFKLKLAPGFNVTIPALNYSGNFTTNISGKVYETGIKTNTSVSRNINVTVNAGNSSLTLVGVDITKPKSIDLTTAFTMDDANKVVGMNSSAKSWNQVVSDLGMGGSSDHLELTFPVSYSADNTLKWCNDALSNCSTVNTYANCTAGSTSKTNCTIPTSLGFSAYQISTPSPGESSGTSTSGGGGGAAAAAAGKSFTVTTSQLASGYTQTLSTSDAVKFTTSDGGSHSVTLAGITSTTATITVKSTPQTVTLKVGEGKKFELTNDTVYDLEVTLTAIVNASKATFVLKSIQEAISAAAVPGAAAGGAPSTGAAVGGAAGAGAAATGPESPKVKSAVKSVMFVGLLAVIILVVAIIVYSVRLQRQRTQKDIQEKVKVRGGGKYVKVSSWFAWGL